jgi:antirestriction protein ArdC
VCGPGRIYGSPAKAGSRRPLRHNGIPYSGINVLMLWATSMERGFQSRIWMTFKQSQELGAHVAIYGAERNRKISRITRSP